MKRLIVGALVSGASLVGMAVPASAWYYPPPPPPPCECPPPPPPPPPEQCKPGWGGYGARHVGYALTHDVPGQGIGDQNHCHSGPPGLAT